MYTLFLALACAPTPPDTGESASEVAPVSDPSSDAQTDDDDDPVSDPAGDDDPIDDGADTGVLDTGEPSVAGPDFASCFQDISGGGGVGPDYDQFWPEIGTHCNGTNHQDISGVERVVFVGDSITVGTPPTETSDLYRNRLALELAAEFNLAQPNFLWQNVNLFDGTTISRESGDFASCAKWGARADDLMQDSSQLEECMPASQRNKRTLVVMTVGGNDLASLTEGFLDGKPTAELWTQTTEFMALVRDAVEWIKAPGRFPNGVYVVFTNLYEFTDGTGDTGSCPAANLAGMGGAVTDPALEQMVVWSMEEYMSIARDTDTDMLFLLENFCGHGYARDDPNGRCYRGPGAELWFDLSCTHPNPRGHEVIADMFMSVVRE